MLVFDWRDLSGKWHPGLDFNVCRGSLKYKRKNVGVGSGVIHGVIFVILPDFVIKSTRKLSK